MRSGPIFASVTDDPWQLDFATYAGLELKQASGFELGYRTATGWSRAIRATRLNSVPGGGITATVETSGGVDLAVSLDPAGSGIISMSVRPANPDGIEAMGLGFERAAGERYFGFGSRSNAVDHAGLTVENYVEDGPTRESDRQYPRAFVPPWSHGERDDSTYYPVPWLLSTRGYGTLIDRDERSRFKLGS